MRIVLDTNVLVRAHANARGPARDLLILVGQEPEHTLLLSPFLLEELERVLGYERVQRMKRLTITENIEYLRYLRRVDVSEMIFPGPAPGVVLADPDDDPVVHTAVTGRADVLCTLNRHFYVPPVVEYCRERGVLIANDLELLRLLRAG